MTGRGEAPSRDAASAGDGGETIIVFSACLILVLAAAELVLAIAL